MTGIVIIPIKNSSINGGRLMSMSKSKLNIGRSSDATISGISNEISRSQEGSSAPRSASRLIKSFRSCINLLFRHFFNVIRYNIWFFKLFCWEKILILAN